MQKELKAFKSKDEKVLDIKGKLEEIILNSKQAMIKFSYYLRLEDEAERRKAFEIIVIRITSYIASPLKTFPPNP